MKQLFFNKLALAFALLFGLMACDPLIGPFTEQAYKNATSLKAQSLALMAKSTQPYANHRAAAEKLMVDVDAAYEYANGLPRNDLSARQWNILRDPNGNLLGGYLRRWRDAGKINSFVMQESRKQIGSAFDTIICLEINKREASACDEL